MRQSLISTKELLIEAIDSEICERFSQTVSSKSFVVTSNGSVPDEINLGVRINARFILHVDEENHKIPQQVNSIGDEENKSHFCLHRR